MNLFVSKDIFKLKIKLTHRAHHEKKIKNMKLSPSTNATILTGEKLCTEKKKLSILYNGELFRHVLEKKLKECLSNENISSLIFNKERHSKTLLGFIKSAEIHNF